MHTCLDDFLKNSRDEGFFKENSRKRESRLEKNSVVPSRPLLNHNGFSNDVSGT